MKTALCLGSSGFIGHHMARRLKSEGYWVRVVDIEPYKYGKYDFCDEFVLGDLRDPKVVDAAFRLNQNKEYSLLPIPFDELTQFDEVFNFQCLMGGAFYVFTGENDADIMHDSALMNLNVCNTLRESKFKGRLFYSSSACIYPQELQNSYNVPALKESDAWPANPDSCYGLEKIFSEQLFLAYARNHGIDIRIARFHNIFGPEGQYLDPKAKAPAALCRKVILSDGEIEVVGTGHQTRSFLYIDDCIDAVRLLMESDYTQPINIGSEEVVTINQLAKMAIELSGKDITIRNIAGPVGVMGRNSDNTLIEKELNWKPKFTLLEGMERTFNWIKSQYETKI
jgi:GDP-D-mannose 3', 5'-epimerase